MAEGLVRDELLAVKLNMQDDSRFALAELSWDGIDTRQRIQNRHVFLFPYFTLPLQEGQIRIASKPS